MVVWRFMYEKRLMLHTRNEVFKVTRLTLLCWCISWCQILRGHWRQENQFISVVGHAEITWYVDLVLLYIQVQTHIWACCVVDISMKPTKIPYKRCSAWVQTHIWRVFHLSFFLITFKFTFIITNNYINVSYINSGIWWRALKKFIYT